MGAEMHKPTVLWRTWVRDVVMYSEATETDPAIFECKVKPININEDGATQDIENDYLLIDYVGHIFTVANVDGLTLRVVDSFRTGSCPQNSQQGIIAKSVWGGRSVNLSPTIISHLHESAKPYLDSLNWDILWSNDGNTRRFDFTETDSPTIGGYQDIMEDGTCLAEDYGDNPKVVLYTIDGDGNRVERSEKPYFIMDDGLIDSITFGVLDGEYTGFITLSK